MNCGLWGVACLQAGEKGCRYCENLQARKKVRLQPAEGDFKGQRPLGEGGMPTTKRSAGGG
jgi:hypothetical protein